VSGRTGNLPGPTHARVLLCIARTNHPGRAAFAATIAASPRIITNSSPTAQRHRHRIWPRPVRTTGVKPEDRPPQTRTEKSRTPFPHLCRIQPTGRSPSRLKSWPFWAGNRSHRRLNHIRGCERCRSHHLVLLHGQPRPPAADCGRWAGASFFRLAIPGPVAVDQARNTASSPAGAPLLPGTRGRPRAGPESGRAACGRPRAGPGTPTGRCGLFRREPSLAPRTG